MKLPATSLLVAPARERGLKFFLPMAAAVVICRSREGAWIEIALSANYNIGEGVAPARERGLKYHILLSELLRINVAPARERGLKSDCTPEYRHQ